MICLWIVVCVADDGEDEYYGPYPTKEIAIMKMREITECSNMHLVRELRSV